MRDGGKTGRILPILNFQFLNNVGYVFSPAIVKLLPELSVTGIVESGIGFVIGAGRVFKSSA